MSNAKKLYAVEAMPAAFVAVPSTVVPTTAVGGDWNASTHESRLGSNGMTDAVIGQVRHPRRKPL